MSENQDELLELEYDYESESSVVLDPVIAFKLGEQLYALPIEVVKEVIKCPEVTPMPELPPHLVGLVNVRGDVYAVTDLAMRFGLMGEEHQMNFLVILDLEGYSLALGVNHVPDTIQIDLSQVQAPDNVNTSDGSFEYVQGFFQKDGELITLLSVEKLVEQDDFSLK